MPAGQLVFFRPFLSGKSRENDPYSLIRTPMQQVTSERGTHLPQDYRPDIDGLRAIAVLAVMLCHAGFVRFAGGFTGVDVFFTISGFVVANSILGDIGRNTFSFKAFYARRARRLMPALYVMLAATFVFSVLFCFPEDAFQLAKNILAVSTMTSNIFLSKQTGYFDTKAADQPLLHTWSLSVEEQFYVVLPVILLWTCRKAKAWSMPVLIGLSVASFGAAVHAASSANAGTYYFAQYRGFEFLAGAVLALREFRRQAIAHRWADCAFLAGLACIIAGVLGLSTMSQFPGWGALVPCAGALLVIYAGRRTTFSARVLSNPWAVFVGKVSYPFYLWHWPILFAARKLDLASGSGIVASIAIAFILAVLTYRFVERTIQRRPMSPRKALACFLGAPLLFFGALAGCGRLTDGFLFAYPAKIQADVRWSGTALFDMPRAKQCWSKVEVSDERACVLGDARSNEKAVLWGDSHAYHLVYFFDQLGRAQKMAIHDAGFTLCPPIAHMPQRPGDMTYEEDHARCVAHDKAVMAYLMSRPDIRTVFMAAAWQNYQQFGVGPNGHGFHQGELEAELAATISALRAGGKRVILMNDVPMIPLELVNCAFNNDLFFPVQRRDCEFDAAIARGQHAPVAAMLERLAETQGASIMHTFDVPCTKERCRLDFDGLPIYRFDDYHHLSLAGSMLLYDRYMARHPGEVQALLGRPADALAGDRGPSDSIQ